MKTLTTIILILFTIGLNAQTEKLYIDNTNTTTPLIPCHDSTLWPNDTSDHHLAIGIDESYLEEPYIPRSNGVFNDTKEVVLSLLIKYETDCYNDSTVSYYYTLCDWDCWDVPCNKGDTLWHGGLCPEHWHHKKMGDLSDFIKWLKLK